MIKTVRHFGDTSAQRSRLLQILCGHRAVRSGSVVASRRSHPFAPRQPDEDTPMAEQEMEKL